MADPFNVVREFERAVADYTGARYCVATNSCSNALLIALAWFRQSNQYTISLPKFTYVSVPQSVLHAGHDLEWRDEQWVGEYQISPLPLWDSARRFTSGMFRKGNMQAVSFHVSKILGLDQGGAILLDDPRADAWLRKARFDGRTEGVPPKDDNFSPGYHCYLSPTIAAHGLWRLSFLPTHNADLPNSDYPDLSKVPLFQKSLPKYRGLMAAE